MKVFTIRRVLLAGVLSLVVLCASWVTPLALGNLSARRYGDGKIALQRPPFLNVANAETSGTQTFADDEAGIAAYININQAVDLTKVREVCRTVEAQTADYIQCSAPIKDYDENQDAKLYASKDGWIMAYYNKAEPTGKIIDWRHFTGDSNLPTKLEVVLDAVVTPLGAAIGTPTYYHFAYPSANRLVLVGDLKPVGVADSYEVNLPSAFTYYQRSWSLGGSLRLHLPQHSIQVRQQHYYNPRTR